MGCDARIRQCAFEWNSGAWFLGLQFGCTAWMLSGFGFGLFQHDLLLALMCLAGFIVVNTIGISIWRRRERLSAYAGLQLFFFAVMLVNTPIVATAYFRGMASQTETLMTLIVAPALMLIFFMREQAFIRSQRIINQNKSCEPVPAK